jgi:predicted transcriptional regulator
MVGRAKDVTDAELAVLQVLWDHGSAAIREITEVVYPHDVETQYSTVKRLLTRLEDKGYVGRDRSEAVHTYEAIVDRDGLVGRRLEALADSLCEGSISPLLTHLAKSERLTKEQQDMLLSLIDDLARSDQDAAKTEKSKRRRKT